MRKLAEVGPQEAFGLGALMNPPAPVGAGTAARCRRGASYPRRCGNCRYPCLGDAPVHREGVGGGVRACPRRQPGEEEQDGEPTADVAWRPLGSSHSRSRVRGAWELRATGRTQSRVRLPGRPQGHGGHDNAFGSEMVRAACRRPGGAPGIRRPRTVVSPPGLSRYFLFVSEGPACPSTAVACFEPLDVLGRQLRDGPP